MNNCPNENNNCTYKEALKKIKHDQKFKPDCCSIVGPTGPTGPSGGPTGPTAPITLSTQI